MFTLLKQRCLHWLGHVNCMEDGHIPKDFLYGVLSSRKRPTGRPQLHFTDVCKQDLKVLAMDTKTRETIASDRTTCMVCKR